MIRDGYKFDGWYKEETLTGDKVTSISIDELKEKAETGIPLYAKWIKVRYSLRYFVNEGIMQGKALTAGNTIYKTEFDNTEDTILDTAIERPGYAFDGWYDGAGEDAKKIETIPAGTSIDVDVCKMG